MLIDIKAILFFWLVLGHVSATTNVSTSHPGLVDYLRDAVWGEGSPVAGHGSTVVRGKGPMTESYVPPAAVTQSNLPPLEGEETGVMSSHLTTARQRVAALELTDLDGRTTQGPREFCAIGACCGWGHRLMRQAKMFTHVHYVQNRSVILEWGPCPNLQGAAGSGKTRLPDFSKIMLEDSPDILNFQDNPCGRGKNVDCNKCGGGNDISTKKWEELVRYFRRSTPTKTLNGIGAGGTDEIEAGSFFFPFQYFVRSLLTQLKPEIKQRMVNFVAENFQGVPVIGVHHRHGNGEIDDFVNPKTGKPQGRLNKNNTRVIEWMTESVHELAVAYNLSDYRVFFATDSPEMARLYRAHDPRVFVFDAEAKEELEGRGFIMPGWQGPGRSHGLTNEEKSNRCPPDTIRAFLDMALLGYVDLLVISKRSSFTFFPSIMMGARVKPVCIFKDGRGMTSFTCRSSPSDARNSLVPRTKDSTGLAPSSRRRWR